MVAWQVGAVPMVVSDSPLTQPWPVQVYAATVPYLVVLSAALMVSGAGVMVSLPLV